MPGCAQLGVAADAALDAGDGPGDSFGGVADSELVGLVCTWDRVEAHAAARKLVAIAEVFRRNPEDGSSRPLGRCRRWRTSSPGMSWPSRWASPGRRRTRCSTVAWHLATGLAATLDA